MGRRTKASEKLAEIDKQLADARSKVSELHKQREAVYAEQRKANNVIVLNNVDALLAFASHSFKNCDDTMAYRNPNCPRCRLIEAKSQGYIDDTDEWSVSVQFTEHVSPGPGCDNVL